MSTQGPRSPVPMLVLGGPLGSGKTTLMARLARSYMTEGVRVGMLVNDVADLGVDAVVLAEAGWPDATVEALNGSCVCCSTDSDLGVAVRAMAELSRDVLLFEATGIADPADMLSQLMAVELAPFIQTPRLVSVIDVTRYPGPFGDGKRMKRLIALADAVVLTKTDVVAGGRAAEATAAVHAENPLAPVLAGELSPADLSRILALPTGAAHVAATMVAGGLLEHEHPHTLSVRLPAPLDPARFAAFLADLPPSIVRAKGFVALDPAATLHLFNYVETRAVTIEPFSLAPREGLEVLATPAEPFAVFIGTTIDEGQIRSGLDACVADCAADPRPARH